jgi:hypothetical protein
MRPQLASAPNIAAFTRLDMATLLATAFAAGLPGAPVTATSMSLVAPSPSAAIMRAMRVATVKSADAKVSKAGPSVSMGGLPARPLAMTDTMSLVDVSPSTDTML